MFIHNFKYTLKTLFKSRSLIFWTFAFPILLGLFFNMAFSDIENNEKLDIINIAVVNNNDFKNNSVVKETFKKLSDSKSEDQIFNTKYVDEEEASKLLKDDEIDGYIIYNGETPKIIVKSSGINQTVLKSVTEEITSTIKIVNELAKTEIEKEIINGKTKINYELIYQNALNIVNESNANIKDTSNSNLSYTMIEFYTLIAMACLYGGILGIYSINKNLPNMSEIGKRVSITPISKGKIILSSVLASYIAQITGLILLFIFTIFVLKVDYGNDTTLIFILALVGSLAGLSLGIAVGSLFKTNENLKTGILISLTMFGCFLSGMMGITMKYLIDKNVPIINKLNPASMITDGFYSLYYYDTLDRYIFNVISLLIFAGILILISFISLRRQKYDSI